MKYSFLIFLCGIFIGIPLFVFAGPHPPEILFFCDEDNKNNEELLNLEENFYFDTFFEEKLEKYKKEIDVMDLLDPNDIGDYKTASSLTKYGRLEKFHGIKYDCHITISDDESEIILGRIEEWVKWVEFSNETAEYFMIFPYSENNFEKTKFGTVYNKLNNIKTDLIGERVGDLLIVYSEKFKFERKIPNLFLVAVFVFIIVGSIYYYRNKK